jgi:transposase
MAVGVDIAKHVFQVHYVEPETGEIVNRPIKRAQFLEYFANRARCFIGMEACSGAHHWARQLAKMGHEVKLMPAEFVKAFNTRPFSTCWPQTSSEYATHTRTFRRRANRSSGSVSVPLIHRW